MKLTKYAHSCLVLEEQGLKVIIDPGAWTPEFGDVSNVVAVVVTHVHPDHLSAKNLKTILSENRNATVLTTREVTGDWGDPRAQVVKAGTVQEVGPFKLEFFGGDHAEIHSLKPIAQNIGVMVNDTLYYPGDSLTAPERPVKVLAMPIAAPWLKMSEAIDYLQAVQPSSFFFRSHEELLSDNGKMVYDTWFKNAAEAYNLTYSPLEPGQSVEL